MAANTKVRGVTIDQLLVNLFSGVNQAFPSGSSLVIDGVTYDKAGLEQKLQEVISPFTKADELHTQLANAVKDRNAAEPGARAFVEKLITGLLYLFGTDANLLAKLGVSAPKSKRQLTVEEKLARAKKAKATRELRHTMGSRQKEDVKAVGQPTITVTLGGGGGGGTAASPGATPVPTPNPAASSSPAAATNGATGPQEVNGAAH